MLRFFVVFLAIQAVLFGLELLAPVQAGFVMPFTGLLADISAVLVKLFDAQVVSHGNVIQNTVNGFGVAIMPGCNGVEACIILIAAIFAFPAPWRAKLVGLALIMLDVLVVWLLWVRYLARKGLIRMAKPNAA